MISDGVTPDLLRFYTVRTILRVSSLPEAWNPSRLTAEPAWRISGFFLCPPSVAAHLRDRLRRSDEGRDEGGFPRRLHLDDRDVIVADESDSSVRSRPLPFVIPANEEFCARIPEDRRNPVDALRSFRRESVILHRNALEETVIKHRRAEPDRDSIECHDRPAAIHSSEVLTVFALGRVENQWWKTGQTTSLPRS